MGNTRCEKSKQNKDEEFSGSDETRLEAGGDSGGEPTICCCNARCCLCTLCIILLISALADLHVAGFFTFKKFNLDIAIGLLYVTVAIIGIIGCCFRKSLLVLILAIFIAIVGVLSVILTISALMSMINSGSSTFEIVVVLLIRILTTALLFYMAYVAFKLSMHYKNGD
ncbi:hypothetical protein RB195_005275 [Necator americanus]|uniref:Uncharacterized protein n=1 Tax=Necator americanus TaxID=51031 RepID=A0ABR1BQX8_NECAM